MQCPQTKANSEKRPPRGGGGTWVNVCSGLHKSIFLSLPHYSLFFGLLQTPSQSLFGKCNFRDPNLINFYLQRDRAPYPWNMVNLFSFGCHVIDRAYVHTYVRTYVRVYRLYGWGRGDYQKEGRGISGVSWQAHIFNIGHCLISYRGSLALVISFAGRK